MNHKFDELTKSLAQSVTRRGALKKFGVGLAGALLASFGAANTSHANPSKPNCKHFVCDCSGLVYSFGCDPQARNFNTCVACCAPHCT